MNLVILDYGMGNLASVSQAFAHLGQGSTISSKGEDIESADALVIPGVGAFGEAMHNIRELNLGSVLDRRVLEDGIPTLGICLGMQLMAESSDEKGHHTGLGWIEGKVRRLSPVPSTLRLPHVGWNGLEIHRKSALFDQVHPIEPGTDFFFDHTFHLECPPDIVTGTCKYGGDVVVSIEKGNVFATQFHPEKSHRFGLKLLRNFVSFAKQSCPFD